MTRTRRLSSVLALAAALGAAPGFCQAPPDDGPEITQTVARVAAVDGEVSYARGDDPDDWQAADPNVPMTLGDRVYTGSGGRLELELHGGDVIRLGSGTDLTALNMTEQTRQFALKSGVGMFLVRDVGPDELFEVDSPNAAITLERSGDYRIDVDPEGNTRVAVRRGSATIAAGGGQVSVGANAGIRIDGLDAPRYEVVALPEPDAWDRWAGERESRVLRAQSRQYVSPAVAGVEDLDEYGGWQRIPEYGWAWSPSSVEAGWAPYRAGRWMWQDPWGWTWVSTEPWGWAPYHSGRWVLASSRWWWVPVAPSVHVVPYAPALVAFVGGGPGFSASVAVGGSGFVGWFPLAPREPLVPWWGRRDARITQVTNVTYVNRTSITVVNQTTFVSGRAVSTGIVTDRAVVREASAAPIVRGPVPVAPTLASTRVSVRGGAATTRPPAATAARPVVARVAPPPAPQRFDEKVERIRQSGGAPVPAAAATRASAGAAQRAPAAAIRPAVTEPGKVTLAPRGGGPAENVPQRVEPVAAPKGRVLATQSQPVAARTAEAPPAARENQASRREEARAEPAQRPVERPSPANAQRPATSVPHPAADQRRDVPEGRKPGVPASAQPQGPPPTRREPPTRPSSHFPAPVVTAAPEPQRAERAAPSRESGAEPVPPRVTATRREPAAPEPNRPAARPAAGSASRAEPVPPRATATRREPAAPEPNHPAARPPAESVKHAPPPPNAHPSNPGEKPATPNERKQARPAPRPTRPPPESDHG